MKKLYLLFIIFYLGTTNLFPQKGWANQFSGTDLVLNSVFFQDQYNGWVAGQSGTLLQTTDGGEHWISGQSGTSASFQISFLFQ